MACWLKEPKTNTHIDYVYNNVVYRMLMHFMCLFVHYCVHREDHIVYTNH